MHSFIALSVRSALLLAPISFQLPPCMSCLCFCCRCKIIVIQSSCFISVDASVDAHFAPWRRTRGSLRRTDDAVRGISWCIYFEFVQIIPRNEWQNLLLAAQPIIGKQRDFLFHSVNQVSSIDQRKQLVSCIRAIIRMSDSFGLYLYTSIPTLLIDDCW